MDDGTDVREAWMDGAKEFKRDSKCGLLYAGLLLGWSAAVGCLPILFSHFKLSSRPQGMREGHAQRVDYLFLSGFLPCMMPSMDG